MKKLTERWGQLCLIVISLVLVVGSATAITVTETPEALFAGSKITIVITDMTDGQTFTTEIYDATVEVEADGSFTFSINDYYFPFSLTNANLVVSAYPVENLELTVTRPDHVTLHKQVSASGGTATITADVGTQVAGSYDITLSGQATTTTYVYIGLSLTGTTADTSPVLETSFVVEGVDRAVIPIRTEIDTVEYLDTTIRIIPYPTGGGGGNGNAVAETETATATSTATSTRVTTFPTTGEQQTETMTSVSTTATTTVPATTTASTDIMGALIVIVAAIAVFFMIQKK